MFWHKEAIFKLKGDKLSSSAECRIWTQGLWHQISSRLNACQQTDWAIEDQAKKKPLNSIAHPHREITPTGISEPRFHAPLHNFTPTPGPAGGGSVAHHWPRLQWAHSLAAFNVALIILVPEIPFNFQFDMQCAGNANSNVSFQVNASFE